jgi:hypothetical protein
VSSERRRSPRVEIHGRVSGTVIPPGTIVVVREMSLGGLAIETPFPLQPGEVHDLLLTLGDGAAVDLRARVMHSRNIADAAAGTPLYLSGFQFIEDESDAPLSAVGDILGKIS